MGLQANEVEMRDCSVIKLLNPFELYREYIDLMYKLYNLLTRNYFLHVKEV
jgi:hypothetical protein